MSTLFAFRALAPTGLLDAGTLSADSAAEARELLSRRGLLVGSIESRGARRERRERISTAELALGLRILADLLESGLPISRALVAFGDLAPKHWQPALPHIRQSVREGQTLATALANAPIVIPPLVIGIAQAGEAGTGLGPAVRRAAELMEATAEMQSAIRSALAYPMVVAAAGACAVTILMTVVLPRFARILADLGQELPASTRLVLRAASTAHAAAVPMLIIATAVVAAWRAWTSRPAGRAQWHRLLLTVPAIGVVRRRAATSRMAHSMSALLESGVAIGTAMTYAARASGDSEIEGRVLAARAQVSSGASLSHALAESRAVSETTIRLIRAGEESGRLPAMLSHAARIEQKGADQIVKTGVRMLEPILLLTFASIVAVIAAALLQAIYSVRPA